LKAKNIEIEQCTYLSNIKCKQIILRYKKSSTKHNDLMMPSTYFYYLIFWNHYQIHISNSFLPEVSIDQTKNVYQCGCAWENLPICNVAFTCLHPRRHPMPSLYDVICLSDQETSPLGLPHDLQGVVTFVE
jgi:hypothetical protein